MKLRRHLSNGGCSRFPTTTISWLLMMVWPDQTLTDVLFSKLMLCQASQLAAPREIWCWQISGRDSYSNRMQSPSGKEFYSSFLRGAPHEKSHTKQWIIQFEKARLRREATRNFSADASIYFIRFNSVRFGRFISVRFGLSRLVHFGSLLFGSFRFVFLDWLKVRKYNAEWHTALTLMRFSLLGDFRSTLSQSLGRNKPNTR